MLKTEKSCLQSPEKVNRVEQDFSAYVPPTSQILKAILAP